MKKSITKYIAMLMAAISLCVTVGCSDDDDDVQPVTEGVIFTLTRKLVYSGGVNEIGSVKITLSDGQKKMILPSMPLTGDEEKVETEPYALQAGTYKVVAYTAYSTRHEFLFDAELDSKNEFTVNSNELTEFRIPIKTREILNLNYLKNALLGVCREIFGDDESAWPWDPQKYPYPDWEGLEFEFDDYGNPVFLSGITFSGMKDGKETPWAKMTAIPDGTLSNIAELMNIEISDIPAFKELPSDLDRLPNLMQLSCKNTGLEELPNNFSNLTTLSSLFLIDCQLKNFDYDLSKMKDLRVLSLAGNQIETFSTSFHGLNKLTAVNLSNNPLKALDESCFDGTTVLNELNLSHTSLSELPQSLAAEKTLRGLDLSSCQLTAVPATVNQLTELKSLALENNRFATLTSSSFSGLENLEYLSLSGNSLKNLPALNLSHLIWLEAEKCGMQETPDLRDYPALRVLYLGGNEISTLPARYFEANPQMRILNLSHSPKLQTLPADLALTPIKTGNKGGFKLMEVNDCVNLHWITPVDWNSYDFTSDNDWIFSLDEGIMDYSTTVNIEDDETECVGVRRSNSPYVQFGK